MLSTAASEHLCLCLFGLLLLSWLTMKLRQVLVGAAPAAPFSQPRNIIGGHALSAAIGVGICQLIGPEFVYLTAPLAVSCSVTGTFDQSTV